MFARRNQRGVAMVTVLFIGAALTVTVSAASFVTIKQFNSSLNDRKATTALAYAEAGIDRLVQYVRNSGQVSWSWLKNAGCPVSGTTRYVTTGGLVTDPNSAPVETINTGTYQAYLTVYNINSSDPATQFPTTTSPYGACAYVNATSSSPHDPHYFVITSTGRAPAAKRVVQQVIKITPKGFPIGLYASTVDAGGTPNIVGDSMVATGAITGREKLVFTGCDPYYTLADMWPDVSFPSSTRCYPQAPSAAHSLGGIALKQNGSDPEFTGPGAGTINCSANGTSGTDAYQSLWDNDGSSGSGAFASGTSTTCNGLTGSPGTSKLTAADVTRLSPQPSLTAEDYDALKQSAIASGIYCAGTTAQTCTINGVGGQSAPNVWQDGDIAPILNAGTKNFVAYFDFTAGTASDNTISWKANVQPVGASGGTVCSTDPTANRSVIIVIHTGSLSLENGAVIEGAAIMDGLGAQFKYNGNPIFDGPIIMSGSNSKINMGGGPTFQLDSCWVASMPMLLTNVTPVHWAEIDR